MLGLVDFWVVFSGSRRSGNRAMAGQRQNGEKKDARKGTGLYVETLFN